MTEIQEMLRYAPITSVLVLIVTGVFLIGLVLARKHGKHVTAYLLGALDSQSVSLKHQYWRLVTANFVHVDLLHYLFNIYFLIDLGTWLEMQMAPLKYLLLLVTSGLFSTGLTYLYDKKKNRRNLTLGASGFAFGILGLLAGLMLFHGSFYQEVLQGFIPLIVINVIYTFIQPNISRTGHIGGLIAGLLVSLIW